MAKKSKSAKPSPICVDIVSDIICPWCWLGKQYFDEAVRKSGRIVEVNWRPFMLDVDIPPEGVPYKEYMRAKFGDTPDNRFKAMRESLEKAGPAVGINFRFSDIPMRPNTLRAHQLVRWASGQDKGSAAKEALFKAVFDELRDIGNIDVLCDIAASLDMDSALIGKLLESGSDADKVTEEAKFFRELGVSGVPTFIYNGQFAISGAQPASAHLDAITQAASLPIVTD